MREATDISPESMAEYKQAERSGRSVYSIYKPKPNQIGKGQLRAFADEGGDALVGSAPAARLALATKAARDRLTHLRGLLGAANPSVGAAAPEAAAAEPTVGAAAPEAAAAEPTVGAAAPEAAAAEPAPAAADPVVGAAPDAAAAEPAEAAAEPVVGSAAESVASPFNPLFKAWPRIGTLPAVHWGAADLFKKLKTAAIVAPIVLQPAHTL